MDTFNHMHVAVVRHAHGLADRKGSLRQNIDSIDDERISLPTADRVPVEARIRYIRMRTSIRIDPTQSVAVGFAEHRYPPGSKQNFHGVVGDQHPRRMRFGKTTIKDQPRPASPL